MKYTDLEYELFARQFILKEFNEETLLKLNKLKITIVGLGGIGCPLSQYLISSGIKNLTLIDGDKIEKSNLNRQILYTIEEIDKYKADISKLKLLKTNPSSNIISYSNNLNENNLNLISESSIIIDTTDDWNTSKLINKYCVMNSINFMFVSAVGYDIQIGYFPNIKNNHICLNCLFPNKDDAEIPRCETIGISGIAAGIAGLLAAQKTINALLHFNDENNILTLFNTINSEIQNIKVKNNKNCLLNKG